MRNLSTRTETVQEVYRGQLFEAKIHPQYVSTVDADVKL